MAANRHQPHVLVLPEDAADRALANGFYLELAPNRSRQFQILSSAGGWVNAVEIFLSDHVAGLRKYPASYFILLVDFDNDKGRATHIKSRIPEDVADRVFVLGALTEPEHLKTGAETLENIGSALARECSQRQSALWDHQLLVHNADERQRLDAKVRSILFT